MSLGNNEYTQLVSLTLHGGSCGDIHDSCAAEKWREWRARFEYYSVATKLDQEEASVQVATLLTVIGAEAHKVLSTFHWTADEDKVLEKVPNTVNLV